MTDTGPTEAGSRLVRVYLSESDHGINALVRVLHDELGVQGVTVVRGIEGYGSSGVVHSASLIDLSGDLPVILEFFDEAEKVRRAIARIAEFVAPGHIVSWPVTVEKG
jgi:PII-like signaling protein